MRWRLPTRYLLSNVTLALNQSSCTRFVDKTRRSVAMTTTWDTVKDARAFAEAAQVWIDEGAVPGFVEQGVDRSVLLGWATDEATLARLRSAVGA